MAFAFEDDEYDWAQPIADETSKVEYQNARIQIIDPHFFVARDYDPDNNTWDVDPGAEGLRYDGRARVIPIRWGVNNGGESQANVTTLKAIRVQIPRFGLAASVYGQGLYGAGPYGYFGMTISDQRIHRGAIIQIIECPRNISLQGRILTINSDTQGSMSATRTFEAMLDEDSEVSA